MRRTTQTKTDDIKFETVVMRLFHLSPGQSEYVFVKRRVPVNDSDNLSLNPGLVPNGDAQYTKRQKRKADHVEQLRPKTQKGAWRANRGGQLTGLGRGKPLNRAPARKGGKKSGATSTGRSSPSKSGTAARMRTGVKLDSDLRQRPLN